MTAFDRAPFIVIWETTRACPLACMHCRAEAIPRRHPDELTTEDPGCTWQPAGYGRVPVIAGGSDSTTAVTAEQVMHALREVLDPELGMSIVELGLVYGIDVHGGGVTVTMTLTAPGCPIHGVMAEWVKAAVLTVPGVESVEVAITFDPPWTPDRIAPRRTRS
jgi:metal-sulfur cluster biosynthetic enzyme